MGAVGSEEVVVVVVAGSENGGCGMWDVGRGGEVFGLPFLSQPLYSVRKSTGRRGEKQHLPLLISPLPFSFEQGQETRPPHLHTAAASDTPAPP